MPMNLDPSAWAYAFPMVRAGGVFIFIMGAGVVLGALVPKRRRSLLVLAAAVATIAMIFSASHLSAPYGAPTKLQLWFLFGSIGAEAIFIRVAVALYRHASERSLLLAILFAVGLHFLPMGMAFGPLCTALGLMLCLCAGIGLWLMPGIPLNTLWASDGLIKMIFGATMLLAY